MTKMCIRDSFKIRARLPVAALKERVTTLFPCQCCVRLDGGVVDVLEHLSLIHIWLMRAEMENMKDLRLCETEVSLRGALNQTSEAQMDALVAELCAE